MVAVPIRLTCFMVKGQKVYEKTNKQNKAKNNNKKNQEPQVEIDTDKKGQQCGASLPKGGVTHLPCWLSIKTHWPSSLLTYYNASFICA